MLVGPTASLSGCEVGDAFLATGCRVFNGATIGARAEVRVNAVVHLRTAVPEDATVPIGWVAVGSPARLFPPADHEGIWAVQRELDFPGHVFGLRRPRPGSRSCRRSPGATGGPWAGTGATARWARISFPVPMCAISATLG